MFQATDRCQRALTAIALHTDGDSVVQPGWVHLHFGAAPLRIITPTFFYPTYSSCQTVDVRYRTCHPLVLGKYTVLILPNGVINAAGTVDWGGIVRKRRWFGARTALYNSGNGLLLAVVPPGASFDLHVRPASPPVGQRRGSHASCQLRASQRTGPVRPPRASPRTLAVGAFSAVCAGCCR